MNKTPENCKDYIKAKSAEALKILMIRNNLKTNSYHDYRIIFDGQNWYAWFEFNASDLIKKETEKALNAKY